jgi:hypothetical protein
MWRLDCPHGRLLPQQAPNFFANWMLQRTFFVPT